MRKLVSHSKIKGFLPLVKACGAVFLFMLSACGFSGGFVSEEKMEKILADAMVLESGNQIFYNFGVLPDSVWERDYAFVCKKYDVDYADFVKQLKYYQDEPEDFSAMMEKVITRLQKSDARYDVKNYHPKNLPSSLRDKALREQGVQQQGGGAALSGAVSGSTGNASQEMSKVQKIQLTPLQKPGKLVLEAQKKAAMKQQATNQ